MNLTISLLGHSLGVHCYGN